MLYEGTPEEYIEAEERRRLYYEEQQQAEYIAYVAKEQAIEQEHPEIYAGVLGLLEGRAEPSVILAWLNSVKAEALREAAEWMAANTTGAFTQAIPTLCQLADVLDPRKEPS